MAAPFHLTGDPASSDYVYARYGNPTWTAFERALGELEGGEALVFSSGMAAAAAVLIPAVGPDEVLVVPEDCFAAVRGIAAEHGTARGAEVRVVPSTTKAMVDAAQGAKLVWAETPTNPALNVVDISAVAEAVCSPSTTRWRRRSRSGRSSSAQTSRWPARRSTSPATAT
jgi:cystathionine gamma-lyase